MKKRNSNKEKYTEVLFSCDVNFNGEISLKEGV